MSNLNPKKEIFQVSGDQSQGGVQGMTGANLVNSALCNPVVLYQSRAMGDMFLTLDVFALPGTPLYAVVRCPICQARCPDSKGMDLTIKEDQKEMSVDHKGFPSFPGYVTADVVKSLGLPNLDAIRGRISVAPFKCTWEAEPELSRSFGFSRCSWSVSITNNIMKDE